MARTETIKGEIKRLIHMAPFRKFVLNMENGDRVLIGHPENIAFDPENAKSSEFYVLTGKVRLFSTFEAVSSVVLADRNGATG
jgi:hypothetical protein